MTLQCCSLARLCDFFTWEHMHSMPQHRGSPVTCKASPVAGRSTSTKEAGSPRLNDVDNHPFSTPLPPGFDFEALLDEQELKSFRHECCDNALRRVYTGITQPSIVAKNMQRGHFDVSHVATAEGRVAWPGAKAVIASVLQAYRDLDAGSPGGMTD
jgi:hypothetical protein